MNPTSPPPCPDHTPPAWSDAPPGWDWLAQDADGRWFWYFTQPLPGIGGGVWRANSRHQTVAGQGAPNPDWYDTLQQRPSLSSAGPHVSD